MEFKVRDHTCLTSFTIHCTCISCNSEHSDIFSRKIMEGGGGGGDS